jgi:hypothetical protein
MKMITRTVDPNYFDQKARQIRTQVSTVLTKWGLQPRFQRWRLTRDPSTGMVVLFGILNHTYIARHTSIPLSEYFEPRILHDFANALRMHVVSCNSDGLRYAFILDRGRVDLLPTHVDYPFLDGDRLLFRVVYGGKPVPEAPEMIEPRITPAPRMAADEVDDQTLIRRGVKAFLKVLDDIKLKDEAALQLSVQKPPDITVIDEDEFKKRVAEHELNQRRINHIRHLLGGNIEISKKMQEAMLYALVNGGKLRRYRGGFWAMENWRHGQRPWFGTSTIKALVSRELMSYTEWQEGRRGRFPIAAIVSAPLTGHLQSNA